MEVGEAYVTKNTKDRQKIYNLNSDYSARVQYCLYISAGHLGKLVSNLLLSVINGESKGEESKTIMMILFLQFLKYRRTCQDTVKVTETLKTNA